MIDADRIYVLIGKRIKDGREAAGLSQAKLADAIKVSRASLANYESGNTAIYISDLYLIAEHTGKDITDFLPSIDEIKAAALPERLLEKLESNEQKEEIMGFIKNVEKKEEPKDE